MKSSDFEIGQLFLSRCLNLIVTNSAIMAVIVFTHEYVIRNKTQLLFFSPLHTVFRTKKPYEVKCELH